MTNTRKIARVGALLLVLCLVSATMMAGTFAKYTSEYAGADTALIAKWKITATDGTNELAALNAEGTNASNLDLFSHLYDTNITQKVGDDYIIAPGVQGDFTVTLQNESDVAATVEIALAESGEDVPIEYSTDNGVTWGNLAAVQTFLQTNLTGTDNVVAVGAPVASKTIKWKWAFEQTDVAAGDIADTALGVGSAGGSQRTNFVLTITMNAEQIAPTE